MDQLKKNFWNRNIASNNQMKIGLRVGSFRNIKL